MNDYLMFSLILAVANTTAFYLLTNRKHKSEQDRKHEYLMMIGITFALSFLLCSGFSMLEKPNISVDKNSLTYSTRPPF
jgi:hypothetical protein